MNAYCRLHKLYKSIYIIMTFQEPGFKEFVCVFIVKESSSSDDSDDDSSRKRKNKG